MKHFHLFILTALTVLCCAALPLVSCSDDNIPVVGGCSFEQTQLLFGEWVPEQSSYAIKGNTKIDNVEIPADVENVSLLYHFSDNGTGWREITVLDIHGLTHVIADSVNNSFIYALKNTGYLTLRFKKGEKITGNKVELHFNGGEITETIGDIDLKYKHQ